MHTNFTNITKNAPKCIICTPDPLQWAGIPSTQTHTHPQ